MADRRDARDGDGEPDPQEEPSRRAPGAGSRTGQSLSRSGSSRRSRSASAAPAMSATSTPARPKCSRASDRAKSNGWRMERTTSARNQASSPVLSIRRRAYGSGATPSRSAARLTKKTTPASGGRLVFAFGAFAGPSYRPHFRPRCGRSHKSVTKCSYINNPLEPADLCGPLPPRASSIDLKDSEHFMQPDHDTSSDVGAGSFCSVPRNLTVLHPAMVASSRGQCRNESNFGRGHARSFSDGCVTGRGAGAGRPSHRATTTPPHRHPAAAAASTSNATALRRSDRRTISGREARLRARPGCGSSRSGPRCPSRSSPFARIRTTRRCHR